MRPPKIAMLNKIKGMLIFILGIAWVIFVYRFDSIAGKIQGFGLKAGICFIMGAVMLVNGIRIFRRR